MSIAGRICGSDFFFVQAEDGIRDLVRSRGLGDVYKRQGLVSPDSERTMATFLGAAAELTPADFSLPIFSDYNYAYMEGYLVFNHDLSLIHI